MKKKIIAAVVAGGLAAGLVAGFGYAKVQISDREEKINAQIAKLAKFLPPNVAAKSEFKSGLLESRGTYKLVQMRDSKEISSFTTSYTLKHGVEAWFGGEIDVETKTKSEGEIAKELKTLVDYIAIGKGKIQKDGSFEIRQDSPEIFFRSIDEDSSNEMDLKIAPSYSVIKYNENLEGVDIELNYPKIAGTLVWTNGEPKSDIDIGNAKIIRKFSTKTPELGEFGLKVGSVKNKSINLTGLDLSAVIGFVQNKYSVRSGIKVASMDIAVFKQVGFEFTYSLSSIDGVAGEGFKALYAKYRTGAAISEADKKAFKDTIRLAAQKGAKISLDKLKVKTPSGLIDLTGSLEIKASPKLEEVYFEDKARLNAKLLVEGPLANTATNMAVAQFGERAGNSSSDNKFSLSLLYDNNQLLANGFEAKAESAIILRQFLRGLDEGLGLKRDLVPLVPELANGSENSGVESSAQINKEVDAALASGNKAKKP